MLGARVCLCVCNRDRNAANHGPNQETNTQAYVSCLHTNTRAAYTNKDVTSPRGVLARVVLVLREMARNLLKGSRRSAHVQLDDN